jgi:hypothetical protein
MFMFLTVTTKKKIHMLELKFHGYDYVAIWPYSETFLNELREIMTTIISITDISLV